jgi:hypothetical protein
MKDTTLIILYPLNIRNFDIERWEIKFLKKTFNVEIHEFHRLLNPNYVNSHKLQLAKNKTIISFNSINFWKKRIIFLKKKYKKIFVLNLIMKDKFYRIIIFFFLKKFRIPRIDTAIRGLPLFKDEQLNIFKLYFNKIKNFFFNKKFRFKIFLITLKINIADLIIKVINLHPDFILAAGKINLKNLDYYNDHKIIFENFNTPDASRYFRQLKCKRIVNFKKYCVFLGEPGPNNPNDLKYLNIKNKLDGNLYYRTLNNFFFEFEKINKIKIIISSHPKALAKTDSKFFEGRQAFNGVTNELIKYSSCVITFASVSLGYALLNKKPIFFIHTITEVKDKFYEYIKLLHRFLDGKLININQYNKYDLLLSNNKINFYKYNNFVKNYISNRSDAKPNYQIINDLINRD